ncbi:hypothetical protein [Candidatus Nitrosocosmicus sp. T]
MGRVAAVLSDFDGTLCPTSDIKQDHNNSELIPSSFENIRCEISLTTPISIITSKDLIPFIQKLKNLQDCYLVF